MDGTPGAEAAGPLAYFILCGFLVFFAVFYWSVRLGSPVLALIGRWLRWILFAVAGGFLLSQFGLSGRPLGVLMLTCFLGWALLETFWNWLSIQAVSESPLPLFPAFTEAGPGEEWPAHPRFGPLRQWLRQGGWRHLQSLRAELFGDFSLRLGVYEDTPGTTRLQVLFIPQAAGAQAVCCTFVSLATDGTRIVTDNLFLPFGGYYPEHYDVERRPWARRAPALSLRHAARVAARGVGLQRWEIDPAADLAQERRLLEKTNLELGFLVPHHEQEEQGRLSRAGRTRVWTEVWLLNYLGRALRYS